MPKTAPSQPATDIQLADIPFHDQIIRAVQLDGTILIALKPLCTNLGIAYNAQYERLQRQPWAVIRMTRTTGADGKTYEMTMIDRRTLPMWLATIDTSRIRNPQARSTIISYQQEAADALDQYFNQGAAIREQAGDSDDDLIARALLAATRKIQERDRKVRQQQRQLEEQKPKVLFADSVETAPTSILVGELARDLRANGVRIGQNRLFQWLRDHGYLISRRGESWNEPTQRAMEQGLFEVRTRVVEKRDGTSITVRTTKVTGRGRIVLTEKLLGEGVG